jgi:hypothetical protein
MTNLRLTQLPSAVELSMLSAPPAAAGSYRKRMVEYLSSAVIGPSSPRRARRAAPSGLQALIQLQAADGSWTLTKELAKALGRRLGELRAAMPGTSGARPAAERAWATALALAWLRRHAADAESEWRLLAAKGERWLDGAEAPPLSGRSWLEEARAFLG